MEQGITADMNLIAHYRLTDVARLAMELTPSQYLNIVPHGGDFRRGPGTELASLASHFPPAHPFEVKPLSEGQLQSMCNLQPGHYDPPPEAIGEVVNTNFWPETVMGSAAPPQHKKKEKKEKKHKDKEKSKKRKRTSEEPLNLQQQAA